jgi:ribonuclease Z
MPRLHLLGTGAALSGGARTTTMLAFQRPGAVLVVDCGGDVVQRLLAHEVPLDEIRAVLLTHEHPDHVSGFPLLMERLWLSGRSEALPVHGPAPALSQARRIFAAFDTSGWEGLPRIEWHEVPLQEDAAVLEAHGWTVTASPGKHSVPVMGVRVEAEEGGVVAYSADTEPHDPIRRLARGADLLVHEATGDDPGHTSMEDAARIAEGAGVKELLLVHLPADPPGDELERAREIFPGTRMAADGEQVEF